MENVLIELVRKLPHTYLMGLVPVLLFSGLYVVTRLRRDKHGKLYFYSQRYEDSKRNRKQDDILSEVHKLTADMIEMKKFREETTAGLAMLDTGDKLQMKMVTENRKDILQLQICVEELPPTAKQLAYWEYKKLGHNSWVDQYVVENNIFTKDEIAYVRNNTEDAGRSVP